MERFLLGSAKQPIGYARPSADGRAVVVTSPPDPATSTRPQYQDAVDELSRERARSRPVAGYLIGGRLVASGELDAGEVTLRASPRSARVELPMNNRGRIDLDISIPLVDPVTGASVDLPNSNT